MFNIIQPVGKCKVVFNIAQRTNKIRFCRENRMKKKQKSSWKIQRHKNKKKLAVVKVLLLIYNEKRF